MGGIGSGRKPEGKNKKLWKSKLPKINQGGIVSVKKFNRRQRMIPAREVGGGGYKSSYPAKVRARKTLHKR